VAVLVGRQRRQPPVERGADAVGVRLGLLGARAGEELVDGPAPQPQPALEVRGLQPGLAVQRHVRGERAAAVGPRAEQHGLPERRDHRHVLFEVELGDVGEQEPDHRVGHRLAVEGAHQALDVLGGLDVAHVHAL
jgi:hypothetical protein